MTDMTQPAEAVTYVEAEHLDSIVTGIWTAFLDSEPEAHFTPEDPDWAADGDRWRTGVVTISGAWNGSVMVSVPAALAVDYAGRLLQVAPGMVTDADVTDAVGELANMLGGAVKSLLPEPSVLSIPVVATGPAAIAGASAPQRWSFIADDHLIGVTIAAHTPA